MITHEIIANGNILKIYFEKHLGFDKYSNQDPAKVMTEKHLHLILSKNNLSGIQSDYIKGSMQHNIIIHLSSGGQMVLKYDTWEKFTKILTIIDQWL